MVRIVGAQVRAHTPKRVWAMASLLGSKQLTPAHAGRQQAAPRVSARSFSHRAIAHGRKSDACKVFAAAAMDKAEVGAMGEGGLRDGMWVPGHLPSGQSNRQGLALQVRMHKRVQVERKATNGLLQGGAQPHLDLCMRLAACPACLAARASEQQVLPDH